MKELISVNWEIVGQWGFGLLFFVAFMFLLKWVLKTQSEILKNAKEEREQWQKVISKFNSELEAHSSDAREYHRQVAEAHRYQREEHKDMIGVLGAIKNGIEIGQVHRSEEHQTIIDTSRQLMTNCVECSKAIARIGGR